MNVSIQLTKYLDCRRKIKERRTAKFWPRLSQPDPNCTLESLINCFAQEYRDFENDECCKH